MIKITRYAVIDVEANSQLDYLENDEELSRRLSSAFLSSEYEPLDRLGTHLGFKHDEELTLERLTQSSETDGIGIGGVPRFKVTTIEDWTVVKRWRWNAGQHKWEETS